MADSVNLHTVFQFLCHLQFFLENRNVQTVFYLRHGFERKILFWTKGAFSGIALHFIQKLRSCKVIVGLFLDLIPEIFTINSK